MKKRRFGFIDAIILVAIILTLILSSVRIYRLIQTDWPTVISAMTIPDWCFSLAALLFLIGIPILRK